MLLVNVVLYAQTLGFTTVCQMRSALQGYVGQRRIHSSVLSTKKCDVLATVQKNQYT